MPTSEGLKLIKYDRVKGSMLSTEKVKKIKQLKELNVRNLLNLPFLLTSATPQKYNSSGELLNISYPLAIVLSVPTIVSSVSISESSAERQ
ncbi:CLUMA_CG012283, isoform A [Clunio marinus]|uniref:CLUMA_CG012283, isoform A n=1 Tax=Clunio marinus TaxID=568069 RepID=A0A1J1IGD6_9DIPT|nr:CLUMA_CG012283, isoform A [Clunio marinus]